VATNLTTTSTHLNITQLAFGVSGGLKLVVLGGSSYAQFNTVTRTFEPTVPVSGANFGRSNDQANCTRLIDGRYFYAFRNGDLYQMDVCAGTHVVTKVRRLSSAEFNFHWWDETGLYGVYADGTYDYIPYPYYVNPAKEARRHWRIFIIGNNGAIYSQMSEIELLVDGADVSFGAITAHSSAFTTEYGADKLIDDSTVTKWTSAGSAQNNSWVSFQLATPALVTQVSISSWALSEANRQPKDFIIQSSEDGVVWTDIRKFNMETGWGDYERRVYNLSLG
jgi:hypothetical protein